MTTESALFSLVCFVMCHIASQRAERDSLKCQTEGKDGWALYHAIFALVCTTGYLVSFAFVLAWAIPYMFVRL